MSHVPLPNVVTFIISSFSVFRYLKTLLAILFLKDKNLEKTISVGVRAAEPTLRSSELISLVDVTAALPRKEVQV